MAKAAGYPVIVLPPSLVGKGLTKKTIDYYQWRQKHPNAPMNFDPYTGEKLVKRKGVSY
jgi:hypothetical protein